MLYNCRIYPWDFCCALQGLEVLLLLRLSVCMESDSSLILDFFLDSADRDIYRVTVQLDAIHSILGQVTILPALIECMSSC